MLGEADDLRTTAVRIAADAAAFSAVTDAYRLPKGTAGERAARSAAAAVAAALTPVPGGVGPVTTALILRHTIEAYEQT